MIRRGVTLLEVLVVAAMIAVLASVPVVLAYQRSMAARAPTAAAATLAEDLALLEHTAQIGKRDEGASLVIISSDPFIYRAYQGRPSSLDPNSGLGAVLVERHFALVRLTGGPIGEGTPLLFASDGRAQYVRSGVLSDPHATVELVLSQRPYGRTATVVLDLFTGFISQL